MSLRAPAMWAIAAFAATTLSCGDVLDAPPETAGVRPAVQTTIEVETARIRLGSIVQRISAPGTIEALREARIGPEVRGTIAMIHVDEGSWVEKGEPLFQIDPEPYKFALRRAVAALDRVKAERRQLETDLERGEELRRKDIVATERTDRIATSVEVAMAMERQAEEAVALERRNFERTLVRAPFAGSVARRLLDEGTTALVQPQTIVIVLQETHVLEAVATIAETHFAAIQVGDVALLHVDGLPLPIRTEVAAVGDSIDLSNRTFRVRMAVPDPEHRLKAGLFTRVEIIPRAKSEVLLAPREALRNQDGQVHVLAVRKGLAVLSPIEVGLISESAVEVLAGLQVDDEVIVGEAARTLGPGMSVRVRNDQP
jgi:RND family efflux transporter MFP subunit